MTRERYIDIVKGLSILSITFLHYEQGVLPQSVNVFIGSFMITAFYVASGWVTAMHQSQRTLKDLIKKRWKQLGIPYLWWTAIILIFDFVLLVFGYYDTYFIGKEIYKSITLRGIGTLWFLPALFGGEIIWHWLKSNHKAWIILLALALSLYYQHFYDQFFGEKTETIYRIIDAPFRTISNILEAWVGIAFGFYTYSLLKNNILQSSKMLLAMCGILVCAFAFITANYLPSSLNPFWSLFAPLFGPIGWLLLAKATQNWSVLNFFNYWGLNSLNLMVTHYSIIMVLFTIVVENGLHLPFIGWTTIVCFILSMPIQYLLVPLIDKYAKYTLGKR